MGEGERQGDPTAERKPGDVTASKADPVYPVEDKSGEVDGSFYFFDRIGLAETGIVKGKEMEIVFQERNQRLIFGRAARRRRQQEKGGSLPAFKVTDLRSLDENLSFNH